MVICLDFNKAERGTTTKEPNENVFLIITGCQVLFATNTHGDFNYFYRSLEIYSLNVWQ